MASLDSSNQQSLERANNLLVAGLKGLRGESPVADTATTSDVSVRGEISSSEAVATEPSALEARGQEFVTKYSIKVLGEGQVSFTLPSGTSRIDLLNEAQALAFDLLRRNAVYPSWLEIWREDSAFTAKVTEALERTIDGNVRGSTGMTRSEQEARGWNNVDLCDLATAHVAYFIATGKDLFDNHVVRARGGALGFSGGNGLLVGGCSDDLRSSSVAASAALPSRN